MLFSCPMKALLALLMWKQNADERASITSSLFEIHATLLLTQTPIIIEPDYLAWEQIFTHGSDKATPHKHLRIMDKMTSPHHSNN